MAILNLRDILQRAADATTPAQGVTGTAILNNDIKVTSTLDIPSTGLIVNTPGTSISYTETYKNRTDQISQPQIIKFKRETHDTFSTKTIQGFEFGTGVEITASTDIFFANIETKVSTSFKYNTSTEKTIESSETVTWEREFPIIIPKQSQTVITYFIRFGGPFTQEIEFWADVTGTFRKGSDPTGWLIGTVIGEIQKQNPGLDVSLPITGPNRYTKLRLKGTLQINGTIGIDAYATEENFPLANNPALPTSRTFPLQTAPRTLFF